MHDLEAEILKQSTFNYNEPSPFICKTCINYKGKLVCEKNVFIAFVGANTKSCSYYVQGQKCPHCGRYSKLEE